MEIHPSIEELPDEPIQPVVTLGNFDGIHRGHQAILARIKEEARKERRGISEWRKSRRGGSALNVPGEVNLSPFPKVTSRKTNATASKLLSQPGFLCL